MVMEQVLERRENRQAMSSEEVFSKYIAPRPWTRLYDEGVPADVEVPEKPLYSILDESSSRYPGHTALVFYGRRVSYRELRDAVDRFANALSERWGVGPGDRVALFLPNSPQFVIAYYGALKTGAAVTPVNVLYTGYELARQIRKSGARVLVALNLFYSRVRDAIENHGARLDAVVFTSAADYLPRGKALLYRLARREPRPRLDGRRFVSLRGLLRSHSPRPPAVRINPREDLAALMFTGGTTGVPKGTMLTHYNLLANTLQIDAWWKRGRKAEDVMVGVLPWFHIYGQTAVLHVGIYRAATILVYPRFEMERILEDIDRYRANVFHGVPTIYSKILALPEEKLRRYNLRSLEVCISGAGALPRAVAEGFEKLTGAKLREGYGLTEASPVTHINPIYGKARIGSIGLPVPSTLAAVADPEEPRLLPPGEIGEIVVSGPQVMKGYLDPEETRRVIFECCGRRWLRTGDMGYMDEEGYFYIVDRKKDVIKYKGYSVYPREIEEVLYMHPCVQDAAVIGVPYPHVGERIKAFVSPKPGCEDRVTPEEILEHARRHLAPYKVPKEVEIRKELPKSAVGKILRRVLREEELRKRGLAK
jgi:long-chain acyl-CoA synthetase